MFCITYFLGNNLGHKGIYLIESLNIIFCSSFFLPFQKHQRSFLKSLCSFGCGICLWSFRSLLLSPLRFCSPIFKRIWLLLENLLGRPPLLALFLWDQGQLLAEDPPSCWGRPLQMWSWACISQPVPPWGWVVMQRAPQAGVGSPHGIMFYSLLEFRVTFGDLGVVVFIWSAQSFCLGLIYCKPLPKSAAPLVSRSLSPVHKVC